MGEEKPGLRLFFVGVVKWGRSGVSPGWNLLGPPGFKLSWRPWGPAGSKREGYI